MRYLLSAFVLFLAGCSAAAAPETPPEYTEPPPVATDGFITTVVEAEIPMSVEEHRAWLLENPFIYFFEPTENISPPASTTDLRDDWLKPNSVRRINLEDGHYVIERVLENRPELFSYQVWIFTSDVALGVDQIIGEQRFIAIDDDTMKFEWTYKIKPKGAITGFFVRQRQPEVARFMKTGTNAMAAAAREEAANREDLAD
ncbi:hypothetical protein [Qipengyuania sp. DGS5-3]|uniref:hypothetical protein n=1 Tax=Qipengyuania sp. DGS5-3 TaxID=3349632 RepID=UPI0036D37A37